MLRRLNASVVLEALRSAGPVTGTDLMAATGLSRPTVHVVCDELIRMGWVHELDSEPPAAGSRPGRRARRYELNARAGYVLGLDMGAQKVTALLADLRGDRVAEATRAFRDARVPATERLATVRKTASAALASARVTPGQVLAVGLGVPGPVDPHSGRINVSEEYLPGLASKDLRAAVGGRTGWPVLVENDANMAVLGERWRGVAAGVENVIVMLAGERLGSGLFLGGNLVRGHAGGAGEMAFLNLVPRAGSAHGIASLARTLGAQAVADLAARRTAPQTHPDGRSLWQLAEGDPHRVQAETVFAAARAGDHAATEILDRIAVKIAHAIAASATLLNPELVVIGGAVADACDALLEPIRRQLPELMDAPPRLATSTLGDTAVVLGAVRLALDLVESRLPSALPHSAST